MKLKTFIIAILSLIVKTCEGEIVLESSETRAISELNRAAVDVIKSCYENRGIAVGVGGIISDNFLKILSKKTPVVLVDGSTNAAIKDLHFSQRPRYRLRVIVLTDSTTEDLRKSIAAFRRSVWWNHMAHFLILYRSGRGCKGAELFSTVSWHLSLINAKILCFDRRSGLRIVGYNPFTSEAPKPWRLIVAYRYAKFKNNRFAVFDRPWNEICENLDFDQSKNLNGYPIEQVYLRRGVLSHTGSEEHIRNDARMYYNVLNTFIRHVNGTDIVREFEYGGDEGYVRDLLIGIVPSEAGLYFFVSRTFVSTGMVAMTQHSGHKSQLEKIITVVDIYTNIGVCVVLVVVALFFRLVVRIGTTPAILNVVRIICNSGLANLPSDTPSRIYLSTVLMFTVTMQGIYQGNFASLLTTVIPFPNINTWEDLAKSRHVIYIHEGYSQFLNYPEFEGRLVLLQDRGDCSEYVLHDSSVACLNFEAILKDQAEELKLHLTETLKSSLGVVRFRPNWYLEYRINDVLGRLFEADVIVPLELRTSRKTLSDFNYDDDVKNNKDFRNITLRDITFAFVILGIGLTCAFATFLFEILINRIKSKRFFAMVR